MQALRYKIKQQASSYKLKQQARCKIDDQVARFKMRVTGYKLQSARWRCRYVEICKTRYGAIRKM